MRATRVLAWAVVLTAAAMATYPAASVAAGHSAVPLFKSSERCNASRWTLPVDGKYNTKGEADPHKLNVHLIAHSHDDPGWLFSIDQYYMQRVQYTLDTVVEELLEDPNRQFMFVEQSFFQRWWHQQSSETKLIVKQLVKEGRLDLSVNGGWCMHDEATPHYTAMVDQTAYGHHLLREEFNITPRIGWQIDPFGHSSTQGSLLSAGVGFDALYFARIDYQDYALRKSKQDLEFIWRPSKSRGKHSQVFTGEIINHYGPPLEFDFAYRERQVQDDSELHDFNVCSQVDDFVRMAHERGASTKGNHIFIPMGGDFQYDNARRWYKNMDKLVHYVNQDNRVSVLYSNLSYYTDLKLAENLTWSVKIDDFFPYASGKYQYWSGFFTSRPALKRFARVSNTLFQQVRQLHALYQTHHAAQLDKLQRAVGLVQHHDGLSGTEKQAVADDYALRLNEGILDAEKELNEVFFVIGEKEKYKFCLLANVSTCNVSTSNEQFEVLVHNALARKSVQTISIPIVFKNVDIQVISGSAKVRQHEVFVAVPVHLDQMAAPYSLVFSTELDPLSEARFLISKKTKAEESDSPKPLSAELNIDAQEKITLENDLMRVKIAKDTGSIISITNKKKNIELPLSSRVLYYQSFQAKNNQRSGAYIFRPDSKTVHPVAGKADKVRLIDLQVDGAASGGAASRVAFQIGKWVTLEYRVNAGDEFVEIEWTVGSIPIGDKKGKEVIIRFNSQKSIKSAKTLYTDSNGLEFITRVRNHRDTWNLKLHDDTEFVAANYFPITTGAYIKDDKYQLNIVTDRAQGAASLEDGQIEVMVHRRLLADDSKGVGEFLNETESFFDKLTQKETTRGLIVRGNFFINVDSATEGIRSIRTKMERQLFAPLVAFRKLSKTKVDGAKVPWLAVTDFPENVGLTTLQRLSRDCVMVRLTHLYSVEEHASLSKPVKVDFSKLFTVQNATISDVSELLLTGIAPFSSQAREPYAAKWKTSELEDPEKLDYDCKASTPLNGGTEVELQAMEVRSFRVCFKKSAEKQAAEYTSGRATGNDDADMKRDFRVVTGEEADLKLTGSAPHLAEMDEIMAVHTGFMSGLPLDDVGKFYSDNKVTAAQLNHLHADHRHKGIVSDLVESGMVVHLAITVNDIGILRVLRKLRERYSNDRRLNFNKAFRCAVLFNCTEMLDFLGGSELTQTDEPQVMKLALLRDDPDADVVGWLYNHYPRKNLDRYMQFQDAVDEAAVMGHLDLLHHFYQHSDKRCHREALNLAAGNGHLDVVKLVVENQTDQITTHHAINSAARRGRFETVKYLVENKIFTDAPCAIDDAARGGHLDIVKYLHESLSLGCTTRAMGNAVVNGHLKIVKFLYQHRVEGCAPDALSKAARNRHLEIVKLFREAYDQRCSIQAADKAAEIGHLPIVKFVHYNCCQGCTTEAMDRAAARHGHLEIVKFLHFNRTEGCTARAMVLAIVRGFYEIVEFLNEHRTECDAVKALKEVVVSRRLEIVKLLCAKVEPGQSAYSAVEAASQGWNRSEIAKYLCEHVDHEPAKFLVQAVDKTAYNVVHAVWKYSSLEELIHAEKHALEQDKPEIVVNIADGVRIKTHAS